MEWGGAMDGLLSGEVGEAREGSFRPDTPCLRSQLLLHGASGRIFLPS